MLLTIEAVAKIVFRWGVDTAFMRLYYDCADQPARQRLASTIFFFLLVRQRRRSSSPQPRRAGWAGCSSPARLARLAGRTGCSSPDDRSTRSWSDSTSSRFQVLRIGERSDAVHRADVHAIGGARSSLRLMLVIWAGMGVLGIVLADVVVTAVFTVILSRVVRAAHPAGVFARGAARSARLRPAAHPAQPRAAGHRRRRSLFPQGLRHAARRRSVFDWRELRPRAEALSERVRIRPGRRSFSAP